MTKIILNSYFLKRGRFFFFILDWMYSRGGAGVFRCALCATGAAVGGGDETRGKMPM